MRSLLTALAVGAVVLCSAGAASADVTVEIEPEASHTIVFGDWLQFAKDDVFNAGHDNTVGSND
ncbi:hypothetical protein ACWEPZ_11370 [Streptomyces sp. NPDC004288]|uniref:hypothetical protein n=1 Tax=unclassified Streptomyces TaxID=2593676 RepID=UPI002E765273|nr:hypothetical protein [Streptomyces sp. SP18ES09]MEE1816412.1 hypothetical protein [Streptomyces sp. SP18ES09]